MREFWREGGKAAKDVIPSEAREPEPRHLTRPEFRPPRRTRGDKQRLTVNGHGKPLTARRSRLPLTSYLLPLTSHLLLRRSHRHPHGYRCALDPAQDGPAFRLTQQRRRCQDFGAVPELPHLARLVLLLRNPGGVEIGLRRFADIASRERTIGGVHQVAPRAVAVPCRIGERRGFSQAVGSH